MSTYLVEQTQVDYVEAMTHRSVQKSSYVYRTPLAFARLHVRVRLVYVGELGYQRSESPRMHRDADRLSFRLSPVVIQKLSNVYQLFILEDPHRHINVITQVLLVRRIRLALTRGYAYSNDISWTTCHFLLKLRTRLECCVNRIATGVRLTNLHHTHRS